MKMARIGTTGNELYIVFDDKSNSRADGLTVTFDPAKADQADIRAAIENLKNKASGYYMLADPDKDAQIGRMSASAEAGKVVARLAGKAEARKEVEKIEAKAAQPQAKKQPAEAKAAPTPPPAKKAAPAPAVVKEVPKPPPLKVAAPVVNADWVGKQLKDAQADTTKAYGAATAIYVNRDAVANTLGPDDPRSKASTPNQASATITIFNALQATDPSFADYLSSQAVDSVFGYRPLADFLSDSTKSRGRLSAPAGDVTLLPAANRFIRDYLFQYGALGGRYGEYREELRQIPPVEKRLENVEPLMTKAKAHEKEKKYSAADAARKLIKVQLEGPMEVATMLASVLFLRRSNSEKQGIAEVSRWKAPAQVEVQVQPQLSREQEAAQKGPLGQFATKNWASLKDELFTAVRGGKPEDVLACMANLPKGQASLDGALAALGRDDVARAVDAMFNKLITTNADFLAFCRANAKVYGGISSSTMLSAETPANDRAAKLRAVQDFINAEAAKKGSLFGQDLRYLCRDVLKAGKDNLESDGTGDTKLLAAYAALNWRSTHRSDPIAGWAKNAKGLPEPARADTSKAAVDTSTQQPVEGKRRVIRTHF